MLYAFNNCDFTKINLDKAPNHDYLIKGKWFDTGKNHEVVVKAPDLFKYHQGELIQNCFPYLSNKDREFLISGTWLEEDICKYSMMENGFCSGWDVDAEDGGPFIVKCECK